MSAATAGLSEQSNIVSGPRADNGLAVYITPASGSSVPRAVVPELAGRARRASVCLHAVSKMLASRVPPCSARTVFGLTHRQPGLYSIQVKQAARTKLLGVWTVEVHSPCAVA